MNKKSVDGIIVDRKIFRLRNTIFVGNCGVLQKVSNVVRWCINVKGTILISIKSSYGLTVVTSNLYKCDKVVRMLVLLKENIATNRSKSCIKYQTLNGANKAFRNKEIHKRHENNKSKIIWFFDCESKSNIWSIIGSKWYYISIVI